MQNRDPEAEEEVAPPQTVSYSFGTCWALPLSGPRCVEVMAEAGAEGGDGRAAVLHYVQMAAEEMFAEQVAPFLASQLLSWPEGRCTMEPPGFFVPEPPDEGLMMESFALPVPLFGSGEIELSPEGEVAAQLDPESGAMADGLVRMASWLGDILKGVTSRSYPEINLILGWQGYELTGQAVPGTDRVKLDLQMESGSSGELASKWAQARAGTQRSVGTQRAWSQASIQALPPAVSAIQGSTQVTAAPANPLLEAVAAAEAAEPVAAQLESAADASRPAQLGPSRSASAAGTPELGGGTHAAGAPELGPSSI